MLILALDTATDSVGAAVLDTRSDRVVGRASFVGPAVIKAVATPGSRVWWEAARALSLQVTLIVAGFAAMVASVVLGLSELMGLVWLVWFAATLTASVRAFNGQSGTGRFERVLLARPQAPRGQLPQTRYHG